MMSIDRRPVLSSGYGSFDGSRASSPYLEAEPFDPRVPIPRSFPPRSGSLNREWTKSTEAVVFKSRRLSGYALEQAEDEEAAQSDIRYSLSDDGEAPSRPYGVLKMQAITRYWTKNGLLISYACLYLLSAITSLGSQTVMTVEPFLLSSFSAHSKLAVVSILDSLVYAVGKPPIAKVLDVYGRAEGIALCVCLYALGNLLIGSCTSVVMFAAAKMVAAFGMQGLQLAIQVIIADTSTLTNRSLITSTIFMPWTVTVFVGPALGSLFLDLGETGYRLPYAIFGLLVPLLTLPLIVTLRRNFSELRYKLLNRPSLMRRRSDASTKSTKQDDAETNSIHEQIKESRSTLDLAKEVWLQLDAVGILLFTLAGIFLLVPFSIAATRPKSWSEPLVWISVCTGLALFYYFREFERRIPRFAILPERLLKDKTIRSGCLLGFFHFCCQAIYESYFTSYIQVARFTSARDAQYIAQAYIVSACVFSLGTGLAVKYSQRYKIWAVVGVLVHIVGAVLMVRFRRLDSPTWELVMSQVIAGIGGGLTMSTAQTGVQSVAVHTDVATATALFLTCSTLGGAVGGAVAGAVWTTLLPARLRGYLPEASQELVPEIVESLTKALSYVRGSPERIAINQAYTDVQWTLNMVSLLALAPCLFSVLAMRNVHLAREDPTPQTVVVLGRASVLFNDDEQGEDADETRELMDQR